MNEKISKRKRNILLSTIPEKTLIKYIIENHHKAYTLEVQDINPDFLKAVGLMTVTFSKLETDVKKLCNCFIKSFDRVHIANIITSEYSFKQLVNVTKCILLETECIEVNDKLFAKIIKAEEDRNTIIHSLYGTRADNVVIRQKSKNYKRGHQHISKEITITEVNKLTNEMIILSEELNKMNAKIREAMVLPKIVKTDDGIIIELYERGEKLKNIKSLPLKISNKELEEIKNLSNDELLNWFKTNRGDFVKVFIEMLLVDPLKLIPNIIKIFKEID